MDKVIVYTILIIIFAGLFFWGFQTGSFVRLFSGPEKNVVATPMPEEGVVLFFGADCPHCKIVEEFITTNNIAQKVKFANLEVPFFNKTSPQLVANAGLAVKLAEGCNIDVSKGLSIPFLFDGKNCLIGDEDVVKFFKDKAGIN